MIVLYKQNMEIDSVNLSIQVQALLKPLSQWMWFIKKYNLILLMTEQLLVQQV